ncbi:hypothetical protein HRbin21_01134 [bacterium HR21]|nr:hypothetical protein HRbin21_01134 [bacterium HR21]
MTSRALLWLLFCLGFAPSFAQVGRSSTAHADPRVAQQLKAAGFSYLVDEDGDYRVTIRFTDDERTQQVFINSSTEFYQGIEIREVWSIAARFEDELPAHLARELLERNSRLKFGAWSVEKAGSSTFVVFRVHLSADTEGQTLGSAIHHVSSVADELEKELTDSDNF